MRILALDLGKTKSVACVYEGTGDEAVYRSVRTGPASLHELVVELEPDRVVFEICPVAGWLADLVGALAIELPVVNVAHDAWRWRNVRAKSDRLDALKLGSSRRWPVGCWWSAGRCCATAATGEIPSPWKQRPDVMRWQGIRGVNSRY
ncbi:hypothetical protein ACERK3_11360 [Phycisphaerales bacterium AB-hyl4]|uniref:Transposase n=1 Tax=Natronomicrosphaera hydrolytica TaxID=3242702 RepID=A0ABV4U5L5_9BACT